MCCMMDKLKKCNDLYYTKLARLQSTCGNRAGHLFLITDLFASYNLHPFILKQVIFIFMQFIC